MILADRWEEYKVLDSSDGEKLERWGKYILLRPDPQVIWHTPKKHPAWRKLNAHYHRSSKGGGEWEFFDLPKTWQINYQLPQGCGGTLTFNLQPFSFKHTGLFPEQAANWDWFSTLIAKRVREGKEVRVLNLFAYTGGATLAAAAAVAAAFFLFLSGVTGDTTGPDRVYEMESVHSSVEVLDTAAAPSDTAAAELPVTE